ncbi:Uncharacterised protein [Mycobacteroides abscessus subsp. abscessus]|nr:Uncharacterised protein [Mycobacteroides abscessus subsp. abscessus]
MVSPRIAVWVRMASMTLLPLSPFTAGAYWQLFSAISA